MTNELVRDGYNRIAETYAAQRDHFKNDAYIEMLASRLVPGSQVLDIGCGTGIPVNTYLLASGFKVTGLDISERMVDLARSANPDASYVVRDMLDLRRNEYAVDAVVSFYAVFHVPRVRHAGLLGVIRSFLAPGGLLLLTMGSTDWPGAVDADFHGADMYWSHFDATTNRGLVDAAGFEVELDTIDTSGGERHQVLLGIAR